MTLPPTSSAQQETPHWVGLLAAMGECAAGHARLVATDAMIAVEHDCMVMSFANPTSSAGQALLALSQLRTHVVDAIEARVRAHFDLLGTSSMPSLQTEMDRARLAKTVRVAIAGLTEAHGEAIAAFGEKFAGYTRDKLSVSLENPVDPARLIQAAVEAQAVIALPPAVRDTLVATFAREWNRELRKLLGDLSNHLIAAEHQPSLIPGTLTGAAQAKAQAALQAAPTTLRGAFDNFDWSTSLGAGEVLPEGPRLQPSLAARPIGKAPEPRTSILPFRRPVSRSEARDKLGALQKNPPLCIRTAFDGVPSELGPRLKEELVEELKAIQPLNMAPLSPRDDYAAGTVGDMFQAAVDGEDLAARAKGTLSRMVVPCLKAAVIDRAPFDQPSHPARKLVASLAEAIKEGNNLPDRSELITRAEDAVDRVVAEFNEDMAILTVIEQELRGFMEQWEMLSQSATPGQVVDMAEAKRVSEINATHALLERTAGVTLPYAVAEFMTGAWHRRLVRFGLQGLSGGVEWGNTLDVADQLLALWSVNPPTRRQGVSTIQALAPMIDAIWMDDGAPRDRAEEHRRQMIVALDDVLRPEDPEPHERQVAKMEAEMAAKPAGPEDREAVVQLRVGDWVVITGPDGTIRQAKLSWVSPISDRRLFVSRQGVRVMVATMDELAALKRIGRLKI